MWFGDLVTMRWWNGIWLNEAFATFMEIAACDAYRPDWQRWTSVQPRAHASRSRSTRCASTRSVEFPVRGPADCDGMFDVLTYQKGGALLRMLEQYLGEERVPPRRQPLPRPHAYGNTETSDLWDAIEAVTTGEPVRRMMDSWIWQPATRSCRHGSTGTTLVLAPAALRLRRRPTTRPLWAIPVHVRVGRRLRRRARCCSTATSCASTARRVRRPRSSSTPAGTASIRVAYDDALRARLSGDALAALDHRRALQPRRRRLERRRRRPLDAAELPRVRRGLRRRARARRVAGDRRRPARLGRLLDGDAFAAFQRRVSALVAPASPISAGAAAGEDDLPRKLRGLLVAMLAVLGDDADAQQRAGELVRPQRGRSQRRSTPSSSPRPPWSSPPPATTTTTSGSSPRSARRDTRRSSSATCTRWPSSTTRRSMQRTCELALSGEVKTQNAPFLLRTLHRQPRHGDAGLEVRPRALGRGQRDVPEATRSCAWSTR